MPTIVHSYYKAKHTAKAIFDKADLAELRRWVGYGCVIGSVFWFTIFSRLGS